MRRLKEILARVGKAIGRVQGFLFFSLVYWLVLFPLAVLTRWSSDPLERKRRLAHWHPSAVLPNEFEAWRRHS